MEVEVDCNVDLAVSPQFAALVPDGASTQMVGRVEEWDDGWFPADGFYAFSIAVVFGSAYGFLGTSDRRRELRKWHRPRPHSPRCRPRVKQRIWACGLDRTPTSSRPQPDEQHRFEP